LVEVPGSAITGVVFAKNQVGLTPNVSNELGFTVGLPYAYIANRASHKITVMDYRDNTIQDSFTVPGTAPTPWAVDLTPDGRYLFIANFSTHNVTIAGTHNHADIINTVPLRCGTATPTNPRAISISQDGSRALVVSDNKYLSIIDVKKAVAGDTCSAVENKQYSAGTYFYDIALTPDVKHAIIPARTNPGQLLEVNVQRYYTVDDNINPQYLNGGTYFLTSGDPVAVNNPYGVVILPQRPLGAESLKPWWGIIVNNGASGDTLEHHQLVRMSNVEYVDTIISYPAGQPQNTCTRGSDAVTSNLGERAFFAFQASANIGITRALEGTTSDRDMHSATRRCSASNTIGCPCPAGTCSCYVQKLAYTPYAEKVLATVWWSNTVSSKIMVLDATTIQMGATGIIPQSHYSCISNLIEPSINGPQGICVQQHFDRDRDKISDLVEAANQQLFVDFYSLDIFHLNPASYDFVNSQAFGNPSNGALVEGVKLPDEGIGYRHFYGTLADFKNGDNWGTMKTIRIIEQVGREWNLLPGLTVNVARPRISIGDICSHDGGCWRPADGCGHENGLELDVRYVRNDGLEGQCNINPDPGLDPPGTPLCNFNYAGTKKLLDLFCTVGAKRIFVDTVSGLQSDTYLPGCLVQANPTDRDHRHHFHVRFVAWP